MYRIMYKTTNKDWECLGSYTDIEMAIEEMDRLQNGVLGGEFKIVREGKC